MKNLSYLARDTNEYDGHEDLIDFVAYIYNQSRSYKEADLRFEFLMKPCLKYFTLNNVTKLLIGLEKNNQVYNRGALSDHMLIKQHIYDNFEGKINLDNYPNFVSSITLHEVKNQEDGDLPF